MKFPKIGMIGSGSWATALSKLLLNNSESVNWFIRSKTDIAYFKENSNNPKYLTSVDFDVKRINFTDSINDCIGNSDFIILAVPSAFLHNTLKDLTAEEVKGKMFFSAVKGIIPEY